MYTIKYDTGVCTTCESIVYVIMLEIHETCCTIYMDMMHIHVVSMRLMKYSYLLNARIFLDAHEDSVAVALYAVQHFTLHLRSFNIVIPLTTELSTISVAVTINM